MESYVATSSTQISIYENFQKLLRIVKKLLKEKIDTITYDW